MPGTVESPQDRDLKTHLGTPNQKPEVVITTEDIKITVDKEPKPQPLDLGTFEKGTARK